MIGISKPSVPTTARDQLPFAVGREQPKSIARASGHRCDDLRSKGAGMAPTDHAAIGGGRLLPCMFSRMLTMIARVHGVRTRAREHGMWRDGTPPLWVGLEYST